MHQTNQRPSWYFLKSILSNLRSTCYSLTPPSSLPHSIPMPNSSSNNYLYSVSNGYSGVNLNVVHLHISDKVLPSIKRSERSLKYSYTPPLYFSLARCKFSFISKGNSPATALYLLLLPKRPETNLTSTLQEALENNNITSHSVLAPYHISSANDFSPWCFSQYGNLVMRFE